MSWGGPEFVLAIIALSTIGWLASDWIRAKHGYPLDDDDEWDGERSRRDSVETQALKAENRQLHDCRERPNDKDDGPRGGGGGFRVRVRGRDRGYC